MRATEFIVEGVAEGFPQPGPSSGAPQQFGPDAKIQTRQMTVKDIISSVPGVPYYNNVVDDWDAKDYSWGVTKKVIEYATYLKDHPESLAKLPPAIVLNGKFEDGAHRVSAIWLLQQRMDPKNPLWKNAKLNVQFVKQGVAEDRHPNDTPPGPETKPTMPKGTVRVDVSDVYDWYKLGKNIPNLKGLSSKDFGKGPPSTIVSFGSEEEEHKYIKDLEKLGLTTTDIDPVDPNQPPGMKRQKVDPTFNVSEADSPAQQAAIAIGIKKARKKPKNESADLTEEFDLIESAIVALAERNQVDAEVIWEDLESLTDDELYVFAVTQPVTEDWQKVNKHDRTSGMSQKAVNAYRREHPGSKLKTAVTTKPSKLKRGSKSSKRRKSYCSRSRGQMKMHHISCAKTPDKAICAARRRWNC